jgi:hypothetical protein
MNSVDLNAIEWTRVGDSWPGKVADDQPGVQYKAFAVGSSAVPSGQLVEYDPGHFEAEHSHVESEIFFIVAGDLVIGDMTLSQGMLAYIPGGTVYGPSVAGPAGTRFLRLHVEPVAG